MSTVKRIRVKNRLAAVVRTPGGKTVAEAVAAAEHGLAEIKDECLEALDETLARMATLAASMKTSPAPASIDQLYAFSNEVVGIAGVFSLGAVGEAAFSLCELLDGLQEAGGWNWPAVEVHLNGLKLLRALGETIGEAEREQILAGLRAVTKRIGPADAEAARA
jgi:hypothetical protein